MELSFISCHSSQENGRYLFVSPTVTEALGWLPSELVGQVGTVLCHPNQFQPFRKLWQEVVCSQLVCFLIYAHAKHKNGEYKRIEIITGICGDIDITTTTILEEEGSSARVIARELTAEDSIDMDLEGKVRILNWNSRNRLRSIFERADGPFPPLPDPEPRTCVILNRYTLFLTILYMSSSDVVEVDPKEAIGTSFLDYVIPSQRQQIQQQITLAKSGNAMARLRFGWMVPRRNLRTQVNHGDGEEDTGEQTGEHEDYWNPKAASDESIGSAGSGSVGGEEKEGMEVDMELEGTKRVVDCEGVLWCSSDGFVCILRKADPEV